MLDERKTAILSAVVKEYVATAQPVGSSRVAAAPGVGVSSATVRNDMVMLEDEGYLAQPHTSAGRVPTDKGYRFFVDQLTDRRRTDDTTSRAVGDFFNAASGRIEELLHQTSDLLTKLTRSAAVVLGPSAEAVPIRSVQIIRLSTTSATLVVVFGNGSVESDVIDIDAEVSDAVLLGAAAHLNAHLDGRTLAALANLPATHTPAVDTIVGSVRDALGHTVDDDQVYVGGASTVADSFDAVEVVRQVLHTLEQQFVVVTLVRDIVDRGMSVAIGGEHGVEPLAACSVVVAPVIVEGEHLGSVGVLGPTRMNYPQALAAVDIVSDRLGKRLGES